MQSVEDIQRFIAQKKQELATEKRALEMLPKEPQPQRSNSATVIRNSSPRPRSAASVIDRRNDDTPSHRMNIQSLSTLKTGEFSPNNPWIREESRSKENGASLSHIGSYEEISRRYRKVRQKEYRDFLLQQSKSKQAQKLLDALDDENPYRKRNVHQSPTEKNQVITVEPLGMNRDHVNGTNRNSSGTNRLDNGTSWYDNEINCDDSHIHSVTNNNNSVDKEIQSYRKQVNTNEEIYSRTNENSGGKNENCRGFGRKVNKDVQCDLAMNNSGFSDTLDSGTHRNDEVNSVHLEGKSSRMVSIGVQTDSYLTNRSSEEKEYTRAERELSPHHVTFNDSTPRNTTICSPEMFFDSDAIHRRNLKAEQEALAKKLCYQQELKRQIMEQQRIKEERLQREKLLEQAERRRLDQQLAQIAITQKSNNNCHNEKQIVDTAGENYEKIRGIIRKDPIAKKNQKSPRTPRNYQYSEQSNLPLYYAYNPHSDENLKTNPHLEECLKRNLNPNLGEYEPSFLRKDLSDLIVRDKIEKSEVDSPNFVNFGQKIKNSTRFFDRPKIQCQNETLQVPLLRNLPKNEHSTKQPYFKTKKNNQQTTTNNQHTTKSHAFSMNSDYSDAMKQVEKKWEVPIVQKNIVKSDRNVLTQLGSIRRQLQLEQLRLDKMLASGQGCT